MKIGIDVGGTNTDSVLIDGKKVVASVKATTSKDVLQGITNSLQKLFTQASSEDVELVMLGTTHFANALVERKGLSETAVIRFGYPYGNALPPFVNFPEQLKAQIKGPVYMMPGGHEFDGSHISPYDEKQVYEVAKKLQNDNIKAVAISSPFSPVNNEIEQRTADILKAEIPDLAVTISSDIGSVGLLERENAAILNSSLLLTAERIVSALRRSLNEIGLTCPFYLTQNDGTLMNVDYVQRFPVLTISSGPTNSMRGASFLSNTNNALVIDVGGTTTDVGVLINGFPRPAANITEIAGVRTNFRMPDVFSLGLGGGTNVRFNDQHLPIIGPKSSGSQIHKDAYIFGGRTLTMTDIVVAAGYQQIGDARNVPLTKNAAHDILQHARDMLSVTLDKMKPSREEIPAILVGGGAIIFNDITEGVSEVIRPEHASVANAIGAAISQIGGEVDQVISLENLSRAEAVEQVKEQAIEQAIHAGAEPRSVEIVEFSETPLAYLPGNASRFSVKAVGNLKEGQIQ
ncbi:N-methylhydantoinase (ATP-hydrolyzing) [Lentibacillus sp. JNUCC-1]|uniref:hydantoinase/oxoprolinase N-terminal domain-containing protein n=1 Tax=Lentibacillus sp. JNUCC-1 TaxID=2654513 RepID=UPI0012E847E6|nr:hydantoinase/oxoprolinase family protein [Lentibacillus sp. JNUCC-1]MUV38763.1 N-methylhydantoinase (ATP-hydrolyzing) [Lentibacillus sp. JNUCC-1]